MCACQTSNWAIKLFYCKHKSFYCNTDKTRRQQLECEPHVTIFQQDFYLFQIYKTGIKISRVRTNEQRKQRMKHKTAMYCMQPNLLDERNKSTMFFWLSVHFLVKSVNHRMAIHQRLNKSTWIRTDLTVH